MKINFPQRQLAYLLRALWLRLALPPEQANSRFLAVPAARRAAAKPGLVGTVRVSARARLARVAQPLRVLRVLESGHSPSQLGRLRISGRMSDVCAELDRLAACEG